MHKLRYPNKTTEQKVKRLHKVLKIAKHNYLEEEVWSELGMGDNWISRLSEFYEQRLQELEDSMVMIIKLRGLK